MHIPKISVIVTFYKEKDYQVRRSVNSVLNQTFQDFELLCILDNPINVEIFSILKEYENNDKRVKAIKVEKNLGISGARNKGAELSKADYICFFDGDDEYLPEKLEKQYKFMLDNYYLDMSGTYTIWKDEDTNNIFYYKSQDIDKSIKYKIPIPITTIIVKKSKLLKFGSFDPSIKISEDYDFVIRWYLQGAKMANLNEHLVVYYRHSHADKNATRNQVVAEIKVKMKYRKELGLGMRQFLRIIFFDLLIVALMPQRLVKNLMFFKNKNSYMKKLN